MRSNPYYQPYWDNRGKSEHTTPPPLKKLDSELQHYGVLGMKWGVRNYQNEDGTLTMLGKLHYKDGRIMSNETMSKWASFVKEYLESSSGVYKNNDLKHAYSQYETWVESMASLYREEYKKKAWEIYDVTGDDSVFGNGSLKWDEQFYNRAYQEANQFLAKDLNDDQKAAFIAYSALKDAGIADQFNIEVNKSAILFIHIKTGTVFKTLKSAQEYAKTIGRTQREKNVQSKGVSVKVDKSKSVSSKPVGSR